LRGAPRKIRKERTKGRESSVEKGDSPSRVNRIRSTGKGNGKLLRIHGKEGQTPQGDHTDILTFHWEVKRKTVLYSAWKKTPETKP